MANKHRSRTTHRRIVVLPHPKRFKQHLPVLVGKIAKTVQRSADRFDQHLRRADRSDGQDGAVEHAAGHRRRGLPDAAAAASLHTLAVLPASPTGGTLGRILLRPVIPGRGSDILQPDAAGIPGRGVVVTRPAGHHHRRTGPFAGHHHPPNRERRNQFDIEQAAGTGDSRPLARLSLREVVPPGRDIAFDPTLHSPPGVKLLPGWLTEFRRAAYQRSRQGRDAE